MSVTNHVFRRGAVYTWRRRIPAGARREGRSAVLQVSLQTGGRREAQRLAAIVTAESNAVFWAMEHHGLSPAAARALLERTIRAAQAQFARAELAAMDEAQAGASGGQAVMVRRLEEREPPGIPLLLLDNAHGVVPLVIGVDKDEVGPVGGDCATRDHRQGDRNEHVQ